MRDDAVFEAIERHRAAWQRLELSAHQIDDELASQKGRVVTPTDERRYRLDDLAEQISLERLLSVMPSTAQGNRALLSYLESLNIRVSSKTACEYFEKLLHFALAE